MRNTQTVNSDIFRMYDIRGLIGEHLTTDLFRKLGQGFGTILRHSQLRSVVVGRDIRLSSPDFQHAFIEGLFATGCEVWDIGSVTTPIVWFAVDHLGTDGGAMITASHNPSEFNGLKLRMEGKPFVAGDLQDLRRVVESEEFQAGEGKLDTANVVGAYVDAISNRIHLSRGLKVVVDAGNGSAGPVAPQLLESLGCEVTAMYCEPDGTFPNHHPDPMKHKNLEDLIEKVREIGAHVGVAYDGDGDRLGIIDNNGNIVTPNGYVALLAREILAERKGAVVVFEVKVSKMLIEEVQKLGGRMVLSKVGYPFMLDAMARENAAIGGEMSGHFYFDDPVIHFDDGIYASARLLQYLSSQEEKNMSDLLTELPKYAETPEIVAPCPDDKKFAVVDEIRDYFKSQGYDVCDIDGARVSIDDGWGVVRVSNTEPRLTLRFEAKTHKDLEYIKQIFRSKLQEYPFVGITF